MRAARGLVDSVDGSGDDALYFGRTGMALALRAVQDDLGDTAAGAAADRALELVRSRFDGTRWGELLELMGGTAGIGLGAFVAGDAELAALAVEPYLQNAEQTPAGVQWAHRPGTSADAKALPGKPGRDAKAQIRDESAKPASDRTWSRLSDSNRRPSVYNCGRLDINGRSSHASHGYRCLPLPTASEVAVLRCCTATRCPSPQGQTK